MSDDKDPLDRIASALEGIELAMMVSAGIWDPPEAEQPKVDFWECSCGAKLGQRSDMPDAECPNCHTCYQPDGQGNWVEFDTG